jgi:hypothetical protein
MNPDLPLIGAAALVFGITPALPRLQALARRLRTNRPADVPRAEPAPVQYAGFYDAHTTVETPLGLVVMAFRYCPDEHQTVAVIVHPDGSATCADAGCGAHIPTTTEGD